jgi:N-acetylglucosamine malate deacetylase 1
VEQFMGLDKVLVLSPHTDDAELGAGATIARFLSEGKEIYWVIFSDCQDSVPEGMPRDTLRAECLRSTDVMSIPRDRVTFLGYRVRTFSEHRQEILEDLVKINQRIGPDLLLVPSSSDMHQDHGTIYQEAVRAFRKDSSIWGYEHPWNNLTFTTDIFVSLKLEHIEAKIRALKEYKSQSKKSYMEERNLRSLACMRGSQLDMPFAEAFELIRLIY